ncbi:hypothetical protein DR999_PMT17206 [Platysternon megacephalum]|uniref:Uncharacterized protein n=1 Tax=Platysternon megacephalum TaxID=55544 RepID=A0A4D9DSS7_9SAUR|nr:hypothetical protein DR999_PMT17206 [Platysternon megacephalum]
MSPLGMGAAGLGPRGSVRHPPPSLTLAVGESGFLFLVFLSLSQTPGDWGPNAVNADSPAPTGRHLHGAGTPQDPSRGVLGGREEHAAPEQEDFFFFLMKQTICGAKRRTNS